MEGKTLSLVDGWIITWPLVMLAVLAPSLFANRWDGYVWGVGQDTRKASNK